MKYSPELAQQYVEKRADFNETDEQLFEELKELGIQGKTVLDLGCGGGRHAEEILAMGASKVIGVDVNESMIVQASERRTEANKENLLFAVSTGESLPLADESTDFVFSNFVLHYFPESAKVLNEIARVLKEGGHFVGTFNVTDVDEGFEHLYNTPMPIRLGQGSDSIVVQNLIKSRTELEDALKQANLIVLKEEELEHPNAAVDSSYLLKDRIHKHAVLFVLQKTAQQEAQ